VIGTRTVAALDPLDQLGASESARPGHEAYGRTTHREILGRPPGAPIHQGIRFLAPRDSPVGPPNSGAVYLPSAMTAAAETNNASRESRKATSRAKLIAPVAEESKEISPDRLTALVGGTAERVATLFVVGVAAISLGALRPLEKMWDVQLWGFQLWDYLPLPLAASAAACGLALCLRPVRERFLSTLTRIQLPRPAWGSALVGLALAIFFFLVRERTLIVGDAPILLYTTAKYTFFFPDVGATWLLHNLAMLANATGLTNLMVVQAGIALAGAATVLCLVGLARIVAPDRALAFVALVMAGGLLRVVAGHVEVYAFVLLVASAYLWSGAACLAGRVPLWYPSLLFGVGLWIHASFAFLAPSLALVVAHHARSQAKSLTPWLLAGTAAAAPAVLFVLGVLITGGSDELRKAWESSISITSGIAGQGGHWLQLPFTQPGPGTEWAALSAPHLRFLANCAYLLAPTALPLILGITLATRSREPASATTHFIGIAALGTIAYALVLRPFWGPYDWDLFSLTALCLSCFAALLWSRCRATWTDSIGLLAAASGFLFVALPSLAIGLHATHQAGPLVHEKLHAEEGEDPWDALNRTIAPWL